MTRVIWITASAALAWCSLAAAQTTPDVPALQALGKQVFFDKISEPERQACATCHVPSNGWTSQVPAIHIGQVASPGADPHTAGNRRPPTAAYASFAPYFGNAREGVTCLEEGAPGRFCRGGLFWDGRATGFAISASDVFGDDGDLAAAYGEFLGPAAEQALRPFSNDVEQNVPDGADFGLEGSQAVCLQVQAAPYAELYTRAFGAPIDCNGPAVVTSFKRVALAISAWEHSTEVNPFSSRRDVALEGGDALTEEELAGQTLFFGKARCALCHNSGGQDPVTDRQQLFTDHSFHNLGLPANTATASYDATNPDRGLSQHTLVASHDAHYRTASLRNVDKRVGDGVIKSYMHNGYFKSLEQVVHYYNTASAKDLCDGPLSADDAIAQDCWPAPEFDTPLTTARGTILLGNLGLSDEEEAALVAFMKTLSDEGTVHKPMPIAPGGGRP